MGLSKVLLRAISALVKVANLLFGLREILAGRFAVPIKGLFVITLDANTILEHGAQIVLRERIALLRCGTIVGQGALVIPRHTPLMLIHPAQLILSRCKALVSGLAIPEQRLAVVLGNAEAVKIVVRQGELRLRVPRSGGPSKRIEVIVRRQCRRLGRRLYRCLRSRRGNQGEHHESCYRGPSPKTHGRVPRREISEKYPERMGLEWQLSTLF